MKTKITTAEQLKQLRPGDTIVKYPLNGEVELHYDETQQPRSDTYDIAEINDSNDMVYLVMREPGGTILSLPGRTSRLFIHKPLLLAQGIWWV